MTEPTGPHSTVQTGAPEGRADRAHLPPAAQRAIPALCAARNRSGTMTSSAPPIMSSRRWPNSAAAAGFQEVTRPPASAVISAMRVASAKLPTASVMRAARRASTRVDTMPAMRVSNRAFSGVKSLLARVSITHSAPRRTPSAAVTGAPA